MNKLLSSVTALLVLFLLVNCSTDPSDPCPNDIERYSLDFTVTDIEAIVAKDSDGNPISDETTPVGLDQLEFEVTLEHFESIDNSVSRDVGSRLADYFIKPAYSCSPRGHRLTSKLVGVSLISNASLGDEFPPGTSLDGIFTAEAMTGNFENTFFNEPLEQITPENPMPDTTRFIIRSSLSLALSAMHRFTLTIDLDNGQRFSKAIDILISGE